MGKLIERTALLNKLLALRGTPDIKIITGIRRCGKSELMRSFLKHVSTTATATLKPNVLYIDLTDLDNEALCEYHALYAFIRERYAPDAENVLCIDEVQMCRGFERAINSLHSKGEWDIYLTGSNAFMLSSDLATLFTGRYIEVHVLPFSFKEYRAFFGPKDLHEQFDAYVRDGGMAGTYPYPDESSRMDYLRSVYETIANRDLVQKRNITNKAAFAALVDYLVNNIGNLSSANKIANSLKTGGRPSSHVTVANNMRYLCEAFLF